MAQTKPYRPGLAAVLALGLVCLLAAMAWAADGQFAGKWKGEAKAAAAPTGGPTGRGPATPGGGAPSTSGQPAAPAAAPTGGGGGGGGRGGFGGGFGGGGSTKVSLNLKQSKDNKLSGNIVLGDGEAYDVKDGKIEGNTITFKAVRTAQPTYEYKGELKGNELTLTRNSPDGRGRPQEYVLTKK